MRILHINCNYLGTPLHQLMVENLQHEGITNDVFVPISDRYDIRVKANPGVCTAVCFKEYDRLFYYIKQFKIRKRLENEYNLANFDCLHAYTLFTDGNCARTISRKYGVPYVVAVRGTDINGFYKKKPYLRRLGYQIMRDAYRVFFLSDKYKDMAIDRFVPEKHKGEIRQKSCVIPNGIDDFWLDNKYENKNPGASLGKHINLIYVGRIMRSKNILMTIEACGHLLKRGYGIHLLIVGKDVEKEILDEALKKPFVEWIPQQPKEALIDYYRKSDIFVMPSLTETFGLVYPEAMSQGLPVIYTQGQGFDGQFPDGMVGYPVLSCSPEDIAEKIIIIANDYKRIADNCIRCSDRFRWASIVTKYKDIYSSLTNE